LSVINFNKNFGANIQMIGLTREQLLQLYTLAGKTAPENPSVEDVSAVLIEIEKRISPEFTKNVAESQLFNNASILIVDDLELSVYQLSKLFSSCGYGTTVARSAEEAIDCYKKHAYQYVIVDLFLPDFDDGLNLIDSINKMEKTFKDDTKIIVISGSDDQKLINECFLKGANEFINKNPDWHKKILQHIGNLEVQKYGINSDITTTIHDTPLRVASIEIANFYKPDIIDTFRREVQILINTGFNNIIVNLEKIKTLDEAGLSAIVFAYKACAEKGGALKLCGVSNAVSDSLSFVFLNNLISIFKDIDSAVFDYKKLDAMKNS